MAIKQLKLNIRGMTCANCQQRIEADLRSLPGAAQVSVGFPSGKASIVYDEQVLSDEAIIAAIKRLGYHPSKSRGILRALGLLFAIVWLYALLEWTGILNLLIPTQLAQQNMGYGMLFIVGLLTSVHCVAMCGGINLSQSLHAGGSRRAMLRPALYYNLGRVISYTVIGALVGALGSVLSLTPQVQGLLKLTAGVFMMLMGFSMLGLFPALSRFAPRLPARLGQRLNKKKTSSRSPLAVGMLNGLMPCGPLQSMQLYALSTGSLFGGALSMLVFSLGTVPLMFGLSALGGWMKRRFTARAMAAGAVLVAVMGLSMITQGMGLSGILLGRDTGSAVNTAVLQDGQQVVVSTLQSGSYPSIVVKAGPPVTWHIDVPDGSINGCNYQITIPQFDLTHTFTGGDNFITFTPTEPGTFGYSCWMGMIRATITVEEES